jgi:hypothetical protein
MTRRVGGSTVYVTASGIAVSQAIPFDQAYALARLVLEDGGGPSAFSGKRADLKKPLVTALSKLGLVDITSSAGYERKVYLLLDVDSHLTEFIEPTQADGTLLPGYVQDKVVVATQEAFDLVARHLPPAH